LNNEIDRFLDSVCAQVRYKPAHQDIRDELASHVMELKGELMKEAADEATALDLAISAMGDREEIGRRLNRQHRPQTEWPLIGLTAVIAAIGGAVMYTSGGFWTGQRLDFNWYLTYAALGIAVMTGLYFFDYTKLKRLAWPLYLLTAALLVTMELRGDTFNAMNLIVAFGRVRISFALVIVPLFLIAFAGFIDKARGKGAAAFLKLCALAAVSVFLIMTRLTLTMSALMLLTCYAVMIAAAVIRDHFGGGRKRRLIYLGALAGGCGLMTARAFLSNPFMMQRFGLWASGVATGNWAEPNGAGYMSVMAGKWLAASNLFGATAEKIGVPGFERLMPNVTTDYALVNVIATLGWAAGILLMLAAAAYIIRMFATAAKIRNGYGFYLSLAACAILAVQFITGILVNLNLLPPSGVYIPFVSYGGAGYIVSMALVGLILSAWRRNKLILTQGLPI